MCDLFFCHDLRNDFKEVVRDEVHPWVVGLLLLELAEAYHACGRGGFDQVDDLSVVYVVCNDPVGAGDL